VQPGKVSGVEQGADLWCRAFSGSGLPSGDARKPTVAAQLAGFGEFGGSAFGVAFEGSRRRRATREIAEIAGWRGALFSSQGIASAVRDCSKCTSPIRKYQNWIRLSRGLRRIHCSREGVENRLVSRARGWREPELAFCSHWCDLLLPKPVKQTILASKSPKSGECPKKDSASSTQSRDRRR